MGAPIRSESRAAIGATLGLVRVSGTMPERTLTGIQIDVTSTLLLQWPDPAGHAARRQRRPACVVSAAERLCLSGHDPVAFDEHPERTAGRRTGRRPFPRNNGRNGARQMVSGDSLR